MKKHLFNSLIILTPLLINAQVKLKETKLNNGKTIIIYDNGTWQEKVYKKPTIEWANIPAGTFTMGSPTNEFGREEDESQHQVTLSSFKMSIYEVTWAQYDLFCKATDREKPDEFDFTRSETSFRGDKLPVVNVSHEDAEAFASWLGCRLPTEAEWEYACRAGSTTPFNTGDDLTSLQENIREDNIEIKISTRQVGSYAPNAWGLYDMHGNVQEMVSDFYRDYSPSPQTNPKGPRLVEYSGEDIKVNRGGSWNNSKEFARSASRSSHYKDVVCVWKGFRLVKIK